VEVLLEIANERKYDYLSRSSKKKKSGNGENCGFLSRGGPLSTFTS
jgi:hypothetical protein